MNTLPEVIENLRPEWEARGRTEVQLARAAAILMAVGILNNEGTPTTTDAVLAEANLVLAQYPDVWPVKE